MIEITRIEEQIRDRLTAELSGSVSVLAMPETQENYSRPVSGVQLTIGFAELRYSDELSTSAYVQEAEAIFQIVIRSRSRSDLFSRASQASRALLGWQPLNTAGNSEEPLYKKKIGFLEYEDGLWSYLLEMGIKLISVEDAETEAGTSLLNVDFNDTIQ